MAPCRDHTSNLRHSGMAVGTLCLGISQFYLHTPRSSANEMNHTCLCLHSRSWYSFIYASLFTKHVAPNNKTNTEN